MKPKYLTIAICTTATNWKRVCKIFLPDFGQFYYNYNICNTKTMGLMYCKCPSKSLTKLCASITLNFNKSFLYCFISTWKFLMINLMVDLLINQVSSVKHKWRLSQNHDCVNQSPLEALSIFIIISIILFSWKLINF